MDVCHSHFMDWTHGGGLLALTRVLTTMVVALCHAIAVWSTSIYFYIEFGPFFRGFVGFAVRMG